MKKEQLKDPTISRNKLLSQRQTLLDYLEMKVEVEDFHAVADAAMDLRELDVRLRILEDE
jgi:hypothetical protein